MRIIVINLARAVERRTTMQQRFAELGLTFEFLEATDGLALTAKEKAMADHDRRRRHIRRPLIDNEIACFISHRRAMAALVASGEPMAAVLEDDVTLSPELPSVLDAIAAQKGRFDVVDLFRAEKPSEFFVFCRPLLPGLALGRIGYAHMGAVGYVISREGATRFLQQTEQFTDEVDRELHRHWINGLDIYGLERPVIFHDDAGASMINEARGRAVDYPDVGRWSDRLHRSGYRLYESLIKRITLPAYVRKGKLGNPGDGNAADRLGADQTSTNRAKA